jgi:geranylgeranyl diphosphate synthase type II
MKPIGNVQPRATPEVNGLSTGLSSTETTETESAVTNGIRPQRRKTSHLKEVPETLELRESLRARCEDVASRLDRSVPMT